MNAQAHSQLPDFCRLPRIAAVCGIMQLVVVLVFISPTRAEFGGLGAFAITSAFGQWLALTAAVVLCQSRGLLQHVRPVPAFILASLLPAVFSAAAAWLMFILDDTLGARLLQPIGVLRFVLSIALMMAILSAVMLRYFYIRDQWREQIRANAKASLQALQARINPHFLFNSMNTIAALVRRDPHTAESAIEDLSDLFRAALGDENAEATLAEELQIARQYLAIEQLRLGARLRVDWRLAADLPMQIRMPRLTLQPLFENAVIHGIAGLPEGGEIEVVLKHVDGQLQLTMSNPLPPGNPTLGHGHALDSIRRRLALYYGAHASLTESTDNGRFSIQLGIPNDPAA
jgi:two-component system sensor histidine kinase AlgZ